MVTQYCLWPLRVYELQLEVDLHIIFTQQGAEGKETPATHLDLHGYRMIAGCQNALLQSRVPLEAALSAL